MNNVMGVDIGKDGGYVADLKAGLIIKPKPSDLIFSMELRLTNFCVYAEDVHPMPKQGVVSSGSLMQQKGELIGMCRALDRRLVLIRPLAWIECVTLKRSTQFETKTLWKKHLLEIAKQIATQESLVNENEITLPTADAFLIWRHGHRIETGNPLQRLQHPKLKFK